MHLQSQNSTNGFSFRTEADNIGTSPPRQQRHPIVISAETTIVPMNPKESKRDEAMKLINTEKFI